MKFICNNEENKYLPKIQQSNTGVIDCAIVLVQYGILRF